MGIKSKVTKGLATVPLVIPLLFGQAIAQPKQEIALEKVVEQEALNIFNFDNLKNVNLSRKTVVVDVYIDSNNPLKQNRDDVERILKYIVNFYKKMDVALDARIVDGMDYSLLKKAEHIGAELLSPGCWKDTVKQFFAAANYFGIDPLEREAVLKEDLKKRGLAILEKDVALVHCHEGRIARDIAYSLTHEIGHLLGLYHSYEFVDDPIRDVIVKFEYDPITHNLKYREYFLNFMGATNKGLRVRLNFNELQKRLIHSFLSKDLVYRQWKEAGYAYNEYIESVKKANNYHYK